MPVRLSQYTYVWFLYKVDDINNDGLLDFTVWGEETDKNYCLVPFLQAQNNKMGQNYVFLQNKGTVLSNAIPPTYFSHTDPEFNGFLVFKGKNRALLKYENIKNQ